MSARRHTVTLEVMARSAHAQRGRPSEVTGHTDTGGHRVAPDPSGTPSTPDVKDLARHEVQAHVSVSYDAVGRPIGSLRASDGSVSSFTGWVAFMAEVSRLMDREQGHAS